MRPPIRANEYVAHEDHIEIRVLSRGTMHSVLISPEDADLVHRSHWQINDRGYAVTCRRIDRTNRSVRMHREILGAERGVEVDHINGNQLDNRRENLRLSDRVGNTQNQRRRVDNTSGYKGVSFWKHRGRWVAYGQIDRRRVHLGYFDDVHEAGRVAREFRAKHYPTSPEARMQ